MSLELFHLNRESEVCSILKPWSLLTKGDIEDVSCSPCGNFLLFFKKDCLNIMDCMTRRVILKVPVLIKSLVFSKDFILVKNDRGGWEHAFDLMKSPVVESIPIIGCLDRPLHETE